MIRNLKYFIILVVITCCACSNSINYKQVDEDFNTTISTATKAEVDSILSRIPSYSSVVSQICANKMMFDQNLILDFSSADMYQNSKETAFALGMFTADLGYIRYYEKVQLCSDFLQALQILSAKLAVGNDIFAKYVPIVEANINNENVIFQIVDSLLSENTIVPAENEKFGITSLFVSGFWLEITHLGLSQEITEENYETLEKHFAILKEINNLFAKISDEELISDLTTQLAELFKKGHKSESIKQDIEAIRQKFTKVV